MSKNYSSLSENIPIFFRTKKENTYYSIALWAIELFETILAVPKVTGSNPVGCTTYLHFKYHFSLRLSLLKYKAVTLLL